ncbi:hypothetical protein BpHYR1_010912 [Brachionus plicatilis]|uniref:Uncharacterized protein n=1 Tax=Brachionus plicatilis TaxID=10195 RepID=A0A3M7QE83_BRAPC|nr:hypothetical protein BpHYR1_010912 [Brachionus plicatilis]
MGKFLNQKITSAKNFSKLMKSKLHRKSVNFKQSDRIIKFLNHQSSRNDNIFEAFNSSRLESLCKSLPSLILENQILNI